MIVVVMSIVGIYRAYREEQSGKDACPVLRQHFFLLGLRIYDFPLLTLGRTRKLDAITTESLLFYLNTESGAEGRGKYRVRLEDLP